MKKLLLISAIALVLAAVVPSLIQVAKQAVQDLDTDTLAAEPTSPCIGGADGCLDPSPDPYGQYICTRYPEACRH